ncbi:MAG: hypothetical protein M0Z61_00530 [Nitrospiraceae bacterium]|nr:hypothetical protein [Nitrospiraceae bacterium]
MNIIKPLPWSIALHLALISSILIAANHHGVSKGGIFPSASLTVNLERSAPYTQKTAMVPDDKELMSIIKKESALAMEYPRFAPSFSLPYSSKAIPRQKINYQQAQWPRMGHELQRMPFSSNMELGGYLLRQKAEFLGSVRAVLAPAIMEAIKKENSGAFDSASATIVLSYDKSGKPSVSDIKSELDGLKALLQRVNWEAAPPPGTYNLHFTGLVIKIWLEQGNLLISAEAF